ncbi:hypothetical protein HID58_057478, partial [Brassica napus]
LTSGDGDTQQRSIPKTAAEGLACGSPRAGSLGLVGGPVEEKMSAPLSPKVATVEGGHGKVSYYDVLLENSSVIKDFPEFMLRRSRSQSRSVNDAIVLEGFTAKDATEKSDTEIVAKLMEDLEAMSGEASLAGATAPVSVAAQTKPLETALNSSEWYLVSYQNSGLAMSSPRAQEDNICVSPNGFQVLQDIREEGEFVEDEDDEVEETTECSKSEAIAHGEDVVVDGSSKKSVGNISTQPGQRIKTADNKLEGPGTGSFSASEGSKAKSKSFLPEALMSSIFAWNMRGFNKPRKQKPTRVNEENFKKIFDATKKRQCRTPKPQRLKQLQMLGSTSTIFLELRSSFITRSLEYNGWGWETETHVTQSRNIRNTIRKIVTADGRILTSPADIKREAASHFDNFLNAPQSVHAIPPDVLQGLIDY